MVLVDTSIWIDHFKKANGHLRKLLLEERVVMHPFVIGELACGNLKNRAEILSLLKSLPQSQKASQEEVLNFVETHRLAGRGIGLIDAHLLASAVLSKAGLWTADRRLREVSSGLGVLFR